MDKILEKDSSFHDKQGTTDRDQFLFFRRFLLVLKKFSFWQDNYTRDYNSIKFSDFAASQILKILNLNLFGNIPCL